MTLYPPDRRPFDVDNRLKALLDALTHSKVWLDDGQVDAISIIRSSERRAGGQAVVTIEDRSA